MRLLKIRRRDQQFVCQIRFRYIRNVLTNFQINLRCTAISVNSKIAPLCNLDEATKQRIILGNWKAKRFSKPQYLIEMRFSHQKIDFRIDQVTSNFLYSLIFVQIPQRNCLLHNAKFLWSHSKKKFA